MKFIVEYSIERDMYNYLNTIWKMKYRSFGRDDLKERLLKKFPEKFQEDIGRAKTEEKAKRVILSYLESRLEDRRALINKNITEIQKALDDKKIEIVKTLEAVFNKKFPFDEIIVYLTTAGICPYNFEKRWFMVYSNADAETSVHVALHELNHFMFYYYYLDDLKRRGINIHKFEVLKEALVVLSGDDRDSKPEAKEIKQFLKPLKGQPMDEIIELAVKSDAFQKITTRDQV